jgi:hypothetical protein
MKQPNIRKEWAGCSNFQEKVKELNEAHQEFLQMIADGWQITNVRKKRPRISKPKTPRIVEVAIFGSKMRMTFAEYQQHGQGLKVIMDIF